MKKILLAMIAHVLTVTVSAQSFEWVTQFGGVAEEIVLSLDSDTNGNIYSTGYFYESATFDDTTLLANGFGDGFICKTDENGAILWAKQIGQPAVGDFEEYNSTIPKAITIDNLGNIIVVGVFQEAMDADPGDGEYLLDAYGDYEMFVVKLDTDGEFIWATSFGTENFGYEEIISVDTDSTGNIYFGGNFSGSIEIIGPAGSNIISSAGQSDLFAMKLSPDGSFNWIKSFGGPESDLVQSVKISDSGNLYLTGTFSNTAIFSPELLGSDPISLQVSGANRGIFALKLDAQGNFVHVIKVGESPQDGIGMGLALDNNPNEEMVYISGTYGGVMTLNEDTEFEFTIDANDQFEAFIAKVNFVEDKVEWAKEVDGGSNPVFAFSIDTDSEFNVYATGYFSNTIIADDFTLTKMTTNAQENFLVKLDPAGNYTAAYQFGGANAVDTQQLKIDGANNIILAGSFESTVDLNPQPSDSGANLYTSGGFRDSYILKLNPEGSLSTTDHQLQLEAGIYPNPVKDKVTIVGADMSGQKLLIYDMLGRPIKTGVVSENNTVDLKDLPKNMYLLKFGTYTFKVIKE